MSAPQEDQQQQQQQQQQQRHHLRSAQRLLLLRPSSSSSSPQQQPLPLRKQQQLSTATTTASRSSSSSSSSNSSSSSGISSRWLSRRVHSVLVGRPVAVAVCAVCATCAGLYAAFDLTQMALDRAVLSKLGDIPGFEQHYRSMRRQWSEGTNTNTTTNNNNTTNNESHVSSSPPPPPIVTGLVSPEDMQRQDPAVSEDLLALQMHLKNLEERVFVRREQAMRDRRI